MPFVLEAVDQALGDANPLLLIVTREAILQAPNILIWYQTLVLR